MPVTDLSIELRRAVVAHLREESTLTALVPAAAIFGEMNPTDADADDRFPFIRVGDEIATGFEASGWAGSESDFMIHAFAHGPGRDPVMQICKRIVARMEVFEPASYGLPDSEWVSTLVLPDEVQNVLHGVVRYRLAIIERDA